MPLVFDQVSYTYADPKQKEKERRAHLRQASKAKRTGRLFSDKNSHSAAAEQAEGAEAPKAAWGADANAVWALRNISLTVEDGEFLGIAGHTGSGKSTLVQHMNGLVHPSEGRVLMDGEDLADKGAALRARSKVGMVFQYPEHQLFAPTVFDDVAFGPRNLGLSAAEVDERVRWALESVQLDFCSLRDKSPFELSGGQQRRVAFAGVLAMKPRMLVLDEPVAGLDPQAREEFLELIASLHARGITTVMVSHNMDDLARLCSRIAVLNQGELFSLGTPSEVFARAEELRGIGLGVPAAQQMTNSLRTRDAKTFRLDRPLYDAETLADDLAQLYRTRSASALPEKPHTRKEAPHHD